MAAPSGSEVWRDYVTNGIPSSGANNPKKADIRSWASWLESLVTSGVLSSGPWFATKAVMTLGYAANTVAVVYNDPTAANNGLYIKSGASGSGVWTQLTSFLPGYQFVTASPTGASTANAIVATTSPRLPAGDGVALVTLVIPATNTASPVTVRFDGGAALTIKTRTGENPDAGELQQNDVVAGFVSGSTFRLISDLNSLRNFQSAKAWANNDEDAPVPASLGGDGSTTFSAKHWAAKSNEDADRSEVARTGAEAARDIAAGYASDAVSQGNVPIYATVVGMPALEIPAGINAIRVNGYYAAGDGGGALYVKVDDEPAHGGKFQTADGAWWEISEMNLDPRQFGAKGDGVADDSNAFSAMDASFKGHVVDLKGRKYRVSSLPTGNRYINGTLSIDGSGQQGGTIDFPMLALKREISRQIAYGDYHSNWTQGKNELSYNSTIFAVWMEGGGHEAVDTHIRIARSMNNGAVFSDFERHFQVAGQARSAFAATIVHGRLVLIVREHSGLHNDSTIIGSSIWSRRISERRERKFNPVTSVDSSAMFLQTFAGQPQVRIGACPKHGMVVGGRFNLTNALGPLNGLNASGDFTVTAVGTDWFEYQPGGNATASGIFTPDFTIRFREGNFVEHLIGGVKLSEAVRAFPGSSRAGTPLFYFHGAAEVPNDNSGALYIGVTGGGFGPSLCKVTGLVSGGASLAKLTDIDSSAARGEPAFSVASNGAIVGFLRTNSPAVTGGLFWSNDDMSSFTLRLNVAGAGNDFQYAPFGISIDKETDNVYAVTTGNRIRGIEKLTTAGEVPVYLLRSTVSDIIANGWTNIGITQFKTVWFSNDSQGDLGNGVGVGSCTFAEGILHVFMSTEKQARNETFGSPDIEYDRLYTTPPTMEEAASRRVAAIPTGVPDVAWAGIFRGNGAWRIMGGVNADGTIAWGDGFSVIHVSGGNYLITPSIPFPSDQFHCSVTINDASPRALSVSHFSNPPRASVRIEGTIDKAFTFTIDVNDQPYRNDWRGVLY